jgi:hypothetical protein
VLTPSGEVQITQPVGIRAMTSHPHPLLVRTIRLPPSSRPDPAGRVDLGPHLHGLRGRHSARLLRLAIFPDPIPSRAADARQPRRAQACEEN